MALPVLILLPVFKEVPQIPFHKMMELFYCADLEAVP